MSMSTSMTTTMERPVAERALEALRRAGNPFRNYFARNPDDEVCARYHVPELYAAERDLLLGVVDLYRYDPMTGSEVVPVLGNKGSGKTHLLHSIKHGGDGAWQLLVTPGVYQKDTDFLEYLLFQIVDTLLGGGRQRGVRPLDYVGEHLTRRLLAAALRDLSPEQRLELFPPPGLGKWVRRLGLGNAQAQERCQWLIDQVNGYSTLGRSPMPVRQALEESGVDAEAALTLLGEHVTRSEPQNTAGLMRRAIYQGFARAHLLGDETDLANFVTYGFAELEFHVRPTRQDLVLALFKVLTEAFRSLKTPVVVAFDQLEDLLLARRSDDAHKIAEAFFAGIVQVMHQIDGLCFLIFAERGLWNRFVPSLDGYIQDRLNNPIHVPQHGTIKALRLEAPPEPLVRRVVEARLCRALDELPDRGDLPDIFPFTDEQVARVARTEPTLRDMLQQFRHLFDHLVYGPEDESKPHSSRGPQPVAGEFVPEGADNVPALELTPAAEPTPNRVAPFEPAKDGSAAAPGGRIPSASEAPTYTVKSVDVFESVGRDVQELRHFDNAAAEETAELPARAPATEEVAPAAAPERLTGPESTKLTSSTMLELWAQEQRSARRKLEPEGALTGATRELQAGLGALLQACHEHGVKVGPWRLQHVVPEFTFGEHPTYGAIAIAHWACKDAQPWKVGVGLFLARSAGKPKDLEVKLSAFRSEPAVIDHLILLRPEDDLSLSGKSKQLWQEAERAGQHARLEPIGLDGFATLSSFPRWLAALTEALPDGQPLPNLADLIQDQCEKLLEQVCLPVQG